MAKYNILREDEESSKEKNKKEKPEDTQEQKTNDDETAEFSPGPKNNARRTPGEEFFTDDIFSAIEADKSTPAADTFEKEEIDISSPEEAAISEMDFPSEDEPEKFGDEEELPAPQQPDYTPAKQSTERPIYDYEDDYKQEGINYKPILIGSGIVAAIVVIYFVVSSLFFGNDVTEPETKVETAAEKLQREQEEQKQYFLAEISKNTNHKLSVVNLLSDLDKENVKYSSILLYDNSLDLEVFAKNRATLAKFNLKFKDNPRIKEYKMETVVNRPGSEGGLFALYDIDLQKIDAGQSTKSQNVKIISPSSWATTVQQQAGLTIHSERKISDRNENLFTINRKEYELRGSFNNCLSLIKSFASSTQNIAVHKLSLLPMNQQKMSSSSYVMKLVVDFYM
jgi:hypothetical protein